MDVARGVGMVAAEAELPRMPCARVPKDVVLPTEVTTPERLALVVTVAALPPMLREEVAMNAKPVPACVTYGMVSAVKEETPVPPDPTAKAEERVTAPALLIVMAAGVLVP